MGRIDVTISDKTEKKLRMKASEIFGKKGYMSKAVEEAIVKWLEAR